jgi:hypothetical protein
MIATFGFLMLAGSASAQIVGNGVSLNAFATNALTTNIISLNAFTQNGVKQNGLHPNGLEGKAAANPSRWTGLRVVSVELPAGK